MVTFGVLGPLRAADERGPIALKGARHRAVLARLLVARGRVVPVTQLIYDLWEEPPRDAVGTIHTFVAALRRVLEPDRAPRQPAGILVTAAPGYALRVASDDVDAGRFETLARGADVALTAGQPADALRRLDTALGLWQGPAYAEFADQSWARGEINRLDELRLLAIEQRARALLDLSRPAEAAAALESHLHDHPLHEQAWRTRALALYRAGRQADALAALRTVRHNLRTELGIDPGPQLRDLESAILAHAPHLTPPTPEGSATKSAAERPPSEKSHAEEEPPVTDEQGPTEDRAPGDTVADGVEGASAQAGTPAESPSRDRSKLQAPAELGGEAVPGGDAAAPGGGATFGGSVVPSGSARPEGNSSSEPISSQDHPRSRASAALVGGAMPAGEAASGHSTAPAGDAPPGGVAVGGFVGRRSELRRLRQAAEGVVAQGSSRLVLVSGEEGAGKTALVARLSRELAGRGWTVAWGSSPADEGAPPNWPWTRISEQLAAAVHGGALPRADLMPGRASAARVGGDDHGAAHTALGSSDDRVDGADGAAGRDPAVARFMERRAAVDYLGSVARGGPVLLVFDDLHWAGEETLELVTELVSAPVAGPVVVVGAYRGTEVGVELVAALARMARTEPVRLSLGGLSEAETGGIVREIAGAAIGAAVVRDIYRRGDGNPFFTRELARLIRDEGDTALQAVPAGVRDVVRHRLGRLTEADRTVLQQASVIGVEVDRELLVRLAGDEERVLAGVEAALGAGFLGETSSPDVAFVHAVVREVVYGEISGPRRAAWHGAVGELLEEAGGSDVAVLAHHFVRAGTRGTAARAAKYARLAAIAAERVFAPQEAARLWADAVAAYARVGEVRGRLEASMGLVRALAVTGRLAEARGRWEETIGAAQEFGDSRLTARVIAAFDVPTVWTEHDDPESARRIVAAAERALCELVGAGAAVGAERPADAELRCRLLTTIALELRATDGERGRACVAQAEEIARQADDPALLAFTLNARYMQTFYRAGLAPERARIGADLVALAHANKLVTFEVLGHLILLQALSATADFDAADEHAAAVGAVADHYGLPLVAVFTRWYAALRDSLSNSGDEAEAAYRSAAAAVPLAAMPGLGRGLLPLALLCVRLRHGQPIGSEPGTDWGPHEPWVRPLLLLEKGRRDEALEALRALPDPPPDLLLELRLCLVARAAVELGEQDVMARVHDRLLPAAGELAGAGTGLVTLEPVAHYLAMVETEPGHRRAR
ncbi:BTAD domain-containing putative transcriptional regulator [Nocardia sp. NPDC127526]|uniref:BTAD domain-containing putative transcriptional regulator n=1 Tax=Nocardia sp. NPDC127526 TaxID=3345393 RepID=UPI0036391DC8